MPRRAYSIDDVAELVGVSASTIRRAIRDGSLKAKRVRRQVRIAADEYERWWTSLPDEGADVRATAVRPLRIATPSPARGRVQRLIDPASFIDQEQQA